MKRMSLRTVVAIAGVLALPLSHPAKAADLISESFDGAFLADFWEVSNDSPDMRALDEGKLSIVTEPGNFSKGEVKNLMFVKDPLSARNADVVLKLEADIQEYGDGWNNRFFAGIALQPEVGTYLATYLTNFRASYNSDSGPYAIYSKDWKGRGRALMTAQMGAMKTGVAVMYLKIEKRGYKYTALASTDGKKWRRVATYAMLNVTPKVGLFAFQHKDAAEAIVAFDDFKITEIQ